MVESQKNKAEKTIFPTVPKRILPPSPLLCGPRLKKSLFNRFDFCLKSTENLSDWNMLKLF